jgi:septum formation protein
MDDGEQQRQKEGIVFMKAHRHCLNLLIHPLVFANWGHSFWLTTAQHSFFFQSRNANRRPRIRSFLVRTTGRSTVVLTTPRLTGMSAQQEMAADKNDNVSQLSLLQELGLPSPLILGSASYTRQLILRELLGGENGIALLVRPIDEKSIGCRQTDTPADLVLRLGQAKMDHLVQEIRAGRCKADLPTRRSLTTASTTANKNGDDESESNDEDDEWVILTGDQVVTCNSKILEKPESVDEAKEFCSRYATFPPSTVGSCILTHLPSGIQVSGVDTATVHFQSSSNSSDDSSSSSLSYANQLVDRLLQDGAPILSCAGGLMVEHPFVKEYIVRIDGTEDSVMGLSKDLVSRLLRELATKVKESKDRVK